MKRTRLIALAMLVAPICAHAQSTRRAPVATMARADSAYNLGDRARARILYADVLARDSGASRAVFRLAQLDDSEERALALYRRYIALEPGDAWGHMAEGDLLGRMGRVEEGLVAYAGANAVAPGERDVFIGRARLLERAGRSELAVEDLTGWLTRHPSDGEAWDLLGRSHLRGGRPRAAAVAFGRAAQLRVPGSDQRWRSASAAAAPFITPEWSSVGDSDGNRSTAFGAAVDFAPLDGLRLGVEGRRQAISNPVDEVSGNEVLARISSVPSRAVNLAAEAGTSRYGEVGAWTTLHATARVRLRAPTAGPSMDLRVERAPLGLTPDLIANRVSRAEARASVEVPVGALRVRAGSRLGRIEAAGEAPNRRTSVEGGLLLPLGSRWLPSVQYRVSAFERASAAGYFAPRLARTAEAGAYVEAGEDGPVSLAADLGAGLQRITEHGARAGEWTRVWRAWAQGSLSLGPSRFWSVEVEAYDSPFALEGASASGHWRSVSVSTGLRWAIR